MGTNINVEQEHIDKAMGSNFHNDIFNLLDSIEKAIILNLLKG